MKSKFLIKLTFVAGISILALNSCKKYLQEDPVTSYGTNVAFADVPSALKSLYGAYNQLAGEQAYGKVISLYMMVDDDNLTGPTYNATDGGDRRSIAHFSVNSLNSEIERPFNQLYTGIERANHCIYYIPRMPQYSSGSAAEQAALRRMHGEALTLRAQFYFAAIVNWGDVPAQFSPAGFIPDLYLPKTDRDSIYDVILNDLLVAEDLVDWRSKYPRDERITKAAVKGLRARIALFRGGYALRRTGGIQRGSNYLDYYKIARDECKSIMDSHEHDLNLSFQAVFKDALDAHVLEPNGEVIFEVGMAGGLATYSSRMGNYDGTSYFNAAVGGPTGQAAVTALPTFFYSFDSLDSRRDVTCAPYTEGAGNIKKPTVISKIAFGKFRGDWITNPVPSTILNYDVNWPLLRYSDVLLMFAEADNEVNGAPGAEAIAAFEKVRKRAFGANPSYILPVTPTNHDDFFNAIVNERSYELAGEGIRKYDLARWNLMKAKIDDTKQKLDIIINTQKSPYPPYDSIPKSIFYKTNSTSLVVANSYYSRTPNSTPDEYTKTGWLLVSGSSLYPGTSLQNQYSNYAQFFRENHSELLPLHNNIVNANYNLTQDYGY